MTDLLTAVEAVKRALRSQAKHISFPDGGAIEIIREQDACRKEVDALPALKAPASPYYASVDDGQSGTVIAAHLSAEQMSAVPLHIAYEMLDDLATNAAAVDLYAGEREPKRNQLLAAYGPALAELVCEGVDEALASPVTGFRRFRNHDGTKVAPLNTEDGEEWYYEDCADGTPHASPTTTFDFYDAIEAARELIEQRDKAAAIVRRGLVA